jgi:hypothetical protein
MPTILLQSERARDQHVSAEKRTRPAMMAIDHERDLKRFEPMTQIANLRDSDLFTAHLRSAFKQRGNFLLSSGETWFDKARVALKIIIRHLRAHLPLIMRIRLIT